MKIRTVLKGLAAVVSAAALVFPSAHAQQTEATRKEVQENKTKAEQGDARAQDSLGRAILGLLMLIGLVGATIGTVIHYL
jgi:hypothetical protein